MRSPDLADKQADSIFSSDVMVVAGHFRPAQGC